VRRQRPGKILGIIHEGQPSGIESMTEKKEQSASYGANGKYPPHSTILLGWL